MAAATGSLRHASPGRAFWLAAAAGWALIGFALAGLVEAGSQTNPAGSLRLLVGLNVVNDAVIVPLALVAALMVRRLAPAWLRAPLQVGLLSSAVVVLYAAPFVSGAGRSSRAGYSRLPLNYAHGLAMVLGAVWVACAVLAVLAWRRHRRFPPA